MIKLNLFLILAAVLSQAAAYALTEKMKPLPDVKPLNCRPCLSFWLTILMGLLTILITDNVSPGIYFSLIYLAAANFFYAKQIKIL